MPYAPQSPVERTTSNRALNRLGPVTAVGLTMVALVLIYRDAVQSYFYNDDFQWLQGAPIFDPRNLLHIERYSHFYRPVIEAYFALGYRLFACDALAFHLASVGIHLTCGLAVFLFGRALTGRAAFGLLSALLFVVQPSYVDAVTWICAIADMLSALWYVLTLFLHLRYLQTGRRWFYAGALLGFVLCLLTHETSATLLAAMLALEWMVVPESGAARIAPAWSKRVLGYVPFAALLLASLTIAYIVNTRGYLVTGGYYRLGWHALPNMVNYVVWLYVGKQIMPSYVAITVVVAALLVRGTPRVRFLVIWGGLALLPPSFFTWGSVGRYLYLPAVPFTLLLAEGLVSVERLLARRMSARLARTAFVLLAVTIAVRFTVFAMKAGDNSRERTRAYERFAAALRVANPHPKPGDVIAVGPEAVYGIEDQYRDPAAQAVFCTPGLRVEIR